MNLQTLIVLFTIYSFFGFLWESFYCTLTSGTWQARGFLYGPICPIYGFGALTFQILLENLPFLSCDTPHYNLKLFLFALVGSAILEFITATLLEVFFNAKWWDYSHLPFNIQGKISLLTTIGFGLAGLIVPKSIIYPVASLISSLPSFVVTLLSYIFIILITVDLTLTISNLSAFASQVSQMNAAFNEYMAKNVENIKSLPAASIETMEEIKEKFFETAFKEIKQKNPLMKLSIDKIKVFSFKEKQKIHISDRLKNYLKKK